MQRTLVSSTNISTIGYDGTTLEVEFQNGSVYQYYNVPKKHYDYMITHEHPGTYLAKYVKGCYKYDQTR